MVSLGALLTNLFDRTTSWLNNQHRSDLSLPALCEELLSNKGEVTGLSLAGEILDRFESEDGDNQKAFLTTLATEFDLDVSVLKSALQAYQTHPDKASYRALMAAAASPRRPIAARRRLTAAAPLAICSIASRR